MGACDHSDQPQNEDSDDLNYRVQVEEILRIAHERYAGLDADEIRARSESDMDLASDELDRKLGPNTADEFRQSLLQGLGELLGGTAVALNPTPLFRPLGQAVAESAHFYAEAVGHVGGTFAYFLESIVGAAPKVKSTRAATSEPDQGTAGDAAPALAYSVPRSLQGEGIQEATAEFLASASMHELLKRQYQALEVQTKHTRDMLQQMVHQIDAMQQLTVAHQQGWQKQAEDAQKELRWARASVVLAGIAVIVAMIVGLQ
ncbi:hypothetical protein [Nesterenkonia sp. CF4.4]|uniref:hypothetical protein n=1 Tax=Nesterenkonia sp. CF4.4 TaxID=3373079 RepID=UPI003EE4841D